MNAFLSMGKLATLLLLFSAAMAHASNPIIKHIYTADPAAAVFDDTVYIYTGHDEASTSDTNYRMNDWHVFSSQDLVNWTDHGEVLSLDDFSWASADAWAGQLIKRGSHYYWYVPVNNDDDGWFGIGVAVGDSPTGPFHDALGYALITDSMTPDERLDIDPTVFVDNDGQAYLYWGNATSGGIIKMVKLKDNMIELDSDIMSIGTDQVPDFTEAPYLHERNGIYYLSYAAGWPERIEYSTADNPMGPFTHQGVILNADDVSSPTSHQSIIEYHNQWYLVYHNADLPDGGEYRRSVAMDRLYYDAAGHIQKVTPTTQGVGLPGIGGEYVLQNRLSHKCLMPQAGATNANTPLVQHTCNGNQRWRLVHTLDDQYTLTHPTSGKRLDINQSSTSNGAAAILADLQTYLSQYWLLDPQAAGDNLVQLRNANSQLLLETTGQSTAEDATVGQWESNGGTHQSWWLLQPNTTQLTAIGFPERYASYRANGVWLEPSPAPESSSLFRIVSGLADGNAISFESINYPGNYLRHRDFVLHLDYNDGSDLFRQDATFYRRTGLSDDSGYSYESYNYPDYYIRHEFYQLRVEQLEDTELDRSDATFIEHTH